MSAHEIDSRSGLPIGAEVDATPARWPAAVSLSGRWARLEPLGPEHADDLFRASSGPEALARFRYLTDEAPRERADVERWLAECDRDGTRVGWAVVDRATGRAGGRFFLMRITPPHRRIEVGNVLFGPELGRTRAATEAIYLLACYALEQLGNRRLEWKCDALNAPSRRAAERFGFVFEGLFRADMIVKDRTRDTAWYAITAADWPRVRTGFERWLDPANFDAAGGQLRKLADLRG